MRKILPMLEAEKTLQAYYEILNESVLEGMDDFNDFIRHENQKRYIPFTRRTKATLLNDYITNRLIDKCANVEGVKVNSTGINGFPFIVFNNSIVARVKKLNKELAPANIPTHITKAYNKQYHIEAFPDNPTLVYFGYRVNSTISNVEGIYIVCRLDNQVQWYIDITHGHREEQATLLNIDPTGDASEPRVKIKKNIKTSENKNTGTDN